MEEENVQKVRQGAPSETAELGNLLGGLSSCLAMLVKNEGLDA